MVRRLKSLFKELGPGLGLLHICDRILRKASPALGLYAYELVAQPIVDRALLPPALVRHIVYEPLHVQHPDVVRLDVPRHVVESRFAAGAKCLAVYRKDELLGYAWWCRSSYHEQEVDCTFVLGDQTESVFDFDLHVRPEHRMGIAFLAIWHGVNMTLLADGVRNSLSRISLFNQSSRRAHARMGARPIGTAVFVRFGRMVLRISSIAPHVDCSLGAYRTMSLRLQPPRP